MGNDGNVTKAPIESPFRARQPVSTSIAIDLVAPGSNFPKYKVFPQNFLNIWEFSHVSWVFPVFFHTFSIYVPCFVAFFPTFSHPQPLPLSSLRSFPGWFCRETPSPTTGTASRLPRRTKSPRRSHSRCLDQILVGKCWNFGKTRQNCTFFLGKGICWDGDFSNVELMMVCNSLQ